MRFKIMIKKRGMTTVEVLLATAIAAIVITGVGTALVHTQCNWEDVYERVNGVIISDAYAAKRAFESMARSSSVSIRPPALIQNGNFIEFYLYENLWSNSIDSYARFYVENNELVLVCGRLDNPGYKEVLSTESGAIEIASDTKDAFFIASSPLTGSIPEPGDDTQTISSDEAVQQLSEGAFVELFSYPNGKNSSGSDTTLSCSQDLSLSKLFGYGQFRKQVLARNVKSVHFSTHGSTVRMILTIDNNGKAKTIICSAVRHSG